jgi:hypothetical protein
VPGEAFNPQNVDKLVDMLHPQMLGADERDFNTATIAAAKEVNVGIFVDRQTEKAWQDAIDEGAVGIQTNFPAELTAYLRAHGTINRQRSQWDDLEQQRRSRTSSQIYLRTAWRWKQ